MKIKVLNLYYKNWPSLFSVTCLVIIICTTVCLDTQLLLVLGPGFSDIVVLVLGM